MMRRDFSKYKDIFGKRIVIYGAGACGQALYRELDSLGYKMKMLLPGLIRIQKEKQNSVCMRLLQ